VLSRNKVGLPEGVAGAFFSGSLIGKAIVLHTKEYRFNSYPEEFENLSVYLIIIFKLTKNCTIFN
jgi:hypothetical protein